MSTWDRIYTTRGPVQVEPSIQIVSLVPIFKEADVAIVLDHGCGTGRHVKYLAEQGFYVIGTDYSPKALEHARELTRGLEVELTESPMDVIPYSSMSIDAVISSHVIHHATEKTRVIAFSEIARVLRKGGLFFLRTISTKQRLYGQGREVEHNTFIDIPDLPDGKTPHHYYTEEELRRCLVGYEILSLEEMSSPPDSRGFWKHGLEEFAVLAKKR
ncbi:MAG TPA: class I SAM-dependent methyltransferase [Candidatus Nanoarchaeia archaeon]|nr:class I SAM-dependent methyltransferase [Candidatus Nanoarchaeia archaeon]